MKRKLTALLICTLGVHAAIYDYSITPVTGFNFSKNDYFGNYIIYGFEIEKKFPYFNHQIYINNGKAESKLSRNDTNILTFGTNAVFEMDEINYLNLTPYSKYGFGWQNFDSSTIKDHAFGNIGFGIKKSLTDNIQFKLEVDSLISRINNRFASDTQILGGINFMFGKVDPKVKMIEGSPINFVQNVPEEIHIDKEPILPIEIKTLIDTDKDGVEDNNDECPNTPLGYKVDTRGCESHARIYINFKYKSSEIETKDLHTITILSNFLKLNSKTKATIFGHTDSIANEAYNLKLSEKRANHIKQLLIRNGIDANRLTSIGKGESMPIATNMEEEGRALNRRIEIEFE